MAAALLASIASQSRCFLLIPSRAGAGGIKERMLEVRWRKPSRSQSLLPTPLCECTQVWHSGYVHRGRAGVTVLTYYNTCVQMNERKLSIGGRLPRDRVLLGEYASIAHIQTERVAIKLSDGAPTSPAAMRNCSMWLRKVLALGWTYYLRCRVAYCVMCRLQLPSGIIHDVRDAIPAAVFKWRGLLNASFSGLKKKKKSSRYHFQVSITRNTNSLYRWNNYRQYRGIFYIFVGCRPYYRQGTPWGEAWYSKDAVEGKTRGRRHFKIPRSYLQFLTCVILYL